MSLIRSTFTQPLRSQVRYMASVGDKIPGNITLFEDSPANKVTTDSLFNGKKVILFGVPGAFTPGCSQTHLPSYIKDYEKFKSKNIDEIICITPNDPFVAGKWKEISGATGKVRVLADVNAELTNKLDVRLDLSGPFGVHGTHRIKRFAAYVDNGEIKIWNQEPDNTGLTCSLAPKILEKL